MSEIRAPRRLFALVPAATLVLALSNVSIPYFAVSPGPARDVGELISIEGAETFPSRGRLFLTTVNLSEVRVAQAVRAWFDDGITLIDRDLIVPPGQSEEDVDEQNTRQMRESQAFAAAAALRLLGHEVKIVGSGARVVTVATDVPAARVLRPGDVIIGADGQQIRRREELVEVIGRHEVGDDVRLTVRRSSEELELTVRTVRRPDEQGGPIIGILIETVVADIELPLEITIDSGPIGGPSAGLMFALGIVDTLKEEDIARGRKVAGTGVISPEGDVGPVGGVEQKVVAAQRSGADLFLVPDGELELACEVTDAITVIGVRTLEDALASLAAPETADRMCGPAPVMGASR